MILRIIDEIEKALSHDLYFAALNLALTLPDICGKAEYPSLRSTRERYIQWYDKIVGVTEKPPRDDEPEMPYLSGEVVYSLRCSLLHEGNPNLQKNGKHPIPIDHFSLVIQSEQPFHIYGGEESCVMTSPDGTEVRSYRVNVRRLCMVLSQPLCRPSTWKKCFGNLQPQASPKKNIAAKVRMNKQKRCRTDTNSVGSPASFT